MIGVGSLLPWPPRSVPPDRGRADMHAWPKFGVSYQTGMTNPACNPELWAALNADAGGDLTRIWAIDAWAVGPNGPGQYAGYMPWERDSGGFFDLHKPNGAYYERLNDYVQAQNNQGITVQITILELYSWSERKQGLLWVPDQNLGPFRKNRNGVKWGDPDDPTFFTLPDETLREFIARVCDAVRGLAVCFEIGNEMPEKEMHERSAGVLRAQFSNDWQPDVTINRDGTPGQYDNMNIGSTRRRIGYERIAYHAKASLAYLDERYDEEPTYQTFRQFWDSGNYNPARIIMSTDGCRARGNVLRPYDFDTLGEVCRDHLRRGFSIEHQSQVKMRPFLENTLNLELDFEGDWLRSLRS